MEIFMQYNPYENIYDDSNYFRTMYPPEISDLYELVRETCDKLEYESSIMYYDHPDKNAIRLLAKEICNSDKALTCDLSLVEVLLINEIFHRRIRHKLFTSFARL